MEESGLQALLQTKGANADQIAGIRKKVAGQIERIASTASKDTVSKDEQGETHVVVLGISLNVKGTIWPLAVCTVKLVIAAHDATGITWAIAADSAIETLEKLAANVHRLGPAERLVCTAIAEKQRDHKDGVGEQDIEAYFREREPPQFPPVGLGDLLSNLVKENVLIRKDYPETGALYRIAF
ncbi:hypothetical protein DAA51_38985 [Bradyrhizobium sp. WBAH10]|nr:hypothetical protein [Bradyrhizobium sp. WBAH30]MDD1547687.1 hypothetical protein [Bradyrhizobium sp. WBAH41]MDD1561340.1 hypothetical protein [Bradyrhizobium sp. WBAH23]MDD1568779.1 hypothetical protein [Bradyrhizobium sp. WBAH33]MDD1594740.1 hypothetical protein [Bradyrhizobium sp. WBAH42]NRB92284.1 hypothetical protein [Bradyrhizobium sp. WBAH10]QCJ93651.1 hypothetical protein DAA57_38790 [Bradyrhizobium yuanmingense]